MSEAELVKALGDLARAGGMLHETHKRFEQLALAAAELAVERIELQNRLTHTHLECVNKSREKSRKRIAREMEAKS